MKPSPKRLEVLLLVGVVAVAGLSLFRSQTSDLHRWKGGGFGMYTDPHPTSRMMWLEGEIEGERTAFRIYPTDERMQTACMRDTELRRDLYNLADLARDIRNYPAGSDLSNIKAQARYVLKQHGDAPELGAIFPRTEVHFKVVELRISPDYGELDTRPITEYRQLW